MCPTPSVGSRPAGVDLSDTHPALAGLHGVVLTGGEGRRIGGLKPLVDVGGSRLVDAALSALEPCRSVRLVGGDATELGALGIEVIPDRWPGEGPLGGIATALAATAGDVMVVACDLPAVDRDTLERIALAGDLPGVDVAVGSTDRRQPLLARWNASSCGRVLEAMASGQRSPTDVLAGLEVAEVPIEAAAAVDVDDDHDLALWRRAHGRDDGVASRIEPMAVRDVAVEDLESALAAGATLIDVREPAEYAEARIEGSTLIPLSTVPDNVERFRSDSTVYVMCRSGGRSLAACEFVASLGLDVVNVEGGIMAWISSGRPVASGDS